MAEVFNIDTLEYRVQLGGWEKIFGFLEELESKKMAAQETRKRDLVTINGQAFEVYPTGQKGEYAYHLSNDRYHFFFRKADTLRNEQLKVKINQFPLWSDGAYQAVEDIRNHIRSMGLVILRESPGRIDLCCHSDSFVLNDRKFDKAVTRATKNREIVNQLEVFNRNDEKWYRSEDLESKYFGKGDPILLRIYNKSAEIEQTGKYWFLNLWEELGLNISRPIVNIEYQCRSSEFFKQLKTEEGLEINTVDELFQNFREVWSYLTRKWFSLRVKNGQKANRRPFTRDWKRVISAGAGFNVSPVVRQKKTECSVDALMPGLVGYLSSLGKFLDAKSKEDLWLKVHGAIAQYETQKNTRLVDLIQKKVALSGES